MNEFITSFNRVISSEGGFTKDSRDRGNWTGGKVGLGSLKGTKYGISAMAYPKLDIEHLSLDQAQEIYKRDYWDKFMGDQLDPDLAYQVFDAAVNHGVSTAVKLLQSSVGTTEDGIMGNITLNRTLSMDQHKVALTFISKRIKYYTSIKTFAYYGKGWMNRMSQNIQYLNQRIEDY